MREVRLLAEGSVSREVSLSGGGDTQTHLAYTRDRFAFPPRVQRGGNAKPVSRDVHLRGESEWWRGHSNSPRVHARWEFQT